MASITCAGTPVEIKSFRHLSDTELSSLGKRVWRTARRAWVHGESDDLIIHAFHEDRLRSAAREARHIRIKLDYYFGRPEKLTKPHVFIVERKKIWKAIRRRTGQRADSIAASLGDEIYLLDEGNSQSYVGSLAHEMTHVWLHGLYGEGIPLWLEEGLAGHIGWEIARDYGDLNGKTLQRTWPAMDVSSMLPLSKLVRVDRYPAQPQQIQAFYMQTAEMIERICDAIGETRIDEFTRGVSESGKDWKDVLQEMGLSRQGVAKIERDLHPIALSGGKEP